MNNSIKAAFAASLLIISTSAFSSSETPNLDCYTGQAINEAVTGLVTALDEQISDLSGRPSNTRLIDALTAINNELIIIFTDTVVLTANCES
jgi:hypothetical protein